MDTEEQQQQIQQTTKTTTSSNSSSPSVSSISLIKLDQVSPFGATKQNRLPALIRMNSIETEEARKTISMPAYEASQLETPLTCEAEKRRASLTTNFLASSSNNNNKQDQQAEKENLAVDMSITEAANDAETSDGFQVVEADCGQSAPVLGPSLPPSTAQETSPTTRALQQLNSFKQLVVGDQPTSQLGDSLIDMIISLRNENQNLLNALETNNEFVKLRIQEFKQASEDSKRREAKFALEKVEHEHELRKVKRQNDVLSERLKSMEAKLKDMRLEVGDSLANAHSSRASSERDLEAEVSRMYPDLVDYLGPFASTSAVEANNGQQQTTIQMDATSCELYNNSDTSCVGPSAPPMDTSTNNEQSSLSKRQQDLVASSDSESSASEDSDSDSDENEATKVGNMSREELSKRFDAEKAAFYAMDDPMKQCDKLEQQLNDIGKRDYEICLLQQQLNIYRQDYRLERMANLEAKIQIEKLKNDIEKLCLDRLQEKAAAREAGGRKSSRHHGHHHHHRERKSSGSGFNFAPAADMVGRWSNHLSRKAVKSAAKAAKFAAKQAKLEERAASAMAAAASYNLDRQSAAASAAKQPQQTNATAESSGEPSSSRDHHHKRHHHHHHRRNRGPRSEVVSDLLSTANKAMMTSYKMASTHVNLALDKLSQFEQAQAAKLAENNGSLMKKDLHQPSLD